MTIRKLLPHFILPFYLFLHFSSTAQVPQTQSSAEIFQQLKKLNVLGSVLYIGAHPDDENNYLLPYLAKEKLYRTAYLSLTRGDGGQNLIGSEQGIELGLIRTQELLAARRMDGAEQYFSRAYEFGFSKSAEEALRIWGHDKILSDVVWVIRNYQPDVIVKRFPPDARAGHGHHAASAILADEAFTAAADPNKFPEQLKYGVKPWQAKRIVWNTFNFGGNNTTAPDQLKLNVGAFNPLIGESYGEIGAEARSMHKSQGEGRPRRRGEIIEYFTTTGGDAANASLMDGIDTTWSRMKGGTSVQAMISNAINDFNYENPWQSVSSLVKINNALKLLPPGTWRDTKMKALQQIIVDCSGLFIDASTSQPYTVQGDDLTVNFYVSKRSNVDAEVKSITLNGFDTALNKVLNIQDVVSISKVIPISANKQLSQPYWLVHPPLTGSFDVRDQMLIGKAESDPSFVANFTVNIDGADFVVSREVQYKYVDPVRGELYQPLPVYPALSVQEDPSLIVFDPAKDNKFKVNYRAYKKLEKVFINLEGGAWLNDTLPMNAGDERTFASAFEIAVKPVAKKDTTNPGSSFTNVFTLGNGKPALYPVTIAYDHIPTITYFKNAAQTVMNINVKTIGKRVGYIAGAGDKVPEALTGLGYTVSVLQEADITDETLKQFDAIVIGIRAYNVYEFLSNKNEILNRYVFNGGNLIAQYIKSNTVGNKSIKIGPYPFTISSRLRVTEEDAAVTFLLPEHRALNYPNKITAKDFENWVQERSTYQAEQADAHYERLLQMHDKDDNATDGSLLIAKYGKGNFAYVSLVLFRQLPAGIPGAYRLLANLIAL